MDAQTQSVNDINIDPAAAFNALQRTAAAEAARWYGEVAARDAYIEQLRARIAELEAE